MKAIENLSHFPWYDYSTGTPKLNEELLEQVMEETGSTDMNVALWDSYTDEEFGKIYTTLICNKGEMAYINYSPDKKYTWLTDMINNSTILEFHTENWDEVEHLRYQLNF